MVISFALMALVAVLLGSRAFGVLRAHLHEAPPAPGLLQTERLAGELAVAGQRTARAVRDVLLTGEARHRAELQALRERFRTLLARLGTGEVPPEERRRLERVAAAQARVEEAMDGVLAGHGDGAPPEALRQRLARELQPAQEALDAALEALLASVRQRQESVQAEAAAEGHRMLWALGAGLLGALLAALGLGSILLRAYSERQRDEAERAHLLERERMARRVAEERQALLDLVIEQSGDAVIMADASGVLRIFNAEAERQHGATRQEVAAPQWASTYGLLTLDGSSLPLEQTPLYRALKGEVVTNGRWLVRRPDGSVRTLCGTASPLHRADGSLVGAVLTARDETERLALEEQRAETLALLDALFASAPVGLAFLDTDLRYLRINETLAALDRVPVQAHLGRTVREVLPELGDVLEPRLRHVLETGESLLGHELTSPRWPHGEPRHFLLNYYVVRGPAGRALGIGATVVDVTSIKRAEEQLRRTAEFRERFLGIVGHDLRSPLNAISLSAETLLVTPGLPERGLRAARRIASSANRMARMIAELLDFARSRLGGGMPIEARPGDLFSLCREVVEELEASHPGANLSLQMSGQGRGEWDVGRLAQVLSNLVINALQHSPDGVRIQVTLDGQAPDGVVLAVHNHGPPISAELLPELFEPFRRGPRQVEEGRMDTGLGLGLYIVQQIILAHGGTIQAASSAELGTTFTVRLPRVASLKLKPGGPLALPADVLARNHQN